MYLHFYYYLTVKISFGFIYIILSAWLKYYLFSLHDFVIDFNHDSASIFNDILTLSLRRTHYCVAGDL